jgi:arsenite methyltransferase
MTQEIYNAVQVRYGNIAKQSHDTQQFRNPNSVEDSLARAFGYLAEDLVSLPEKANLGVSCGNPVAVAGIKEVRIPTNVSVRLLEKNLKKPDSENIVAWLNC